MPLSNIVRKFAPRREQVVYNMVWVVHDASRRLLRIWTGWAKKWHPFKLRQYNAIK